LVSASISFSDVSLNTKRVLSEPNANGNREYKLVDPLICLSMVGAGLTCVNKIPPSWIQDGFWVHVSFFVGYNHYHNMPPNHKGIHLREEEV